MSKFVPYEKLSKKKKREQDRQMRVTWAMDPVTRRRENKKVYNRKKLRFDGDAYPKTELYYFNPA